VDKQKVSTYPTHFCRNLPILETGAIFNLNLISSCLSKGSPKEKKEKNFKKYIKI
jgi:hypothetical protein